MKFSHGKHKKLDITLDDRKIVLQQEEKGQEDIK